jgi:hypothetical protein
VQGIGHRLGLRLTHLVPVIGVQISQFTLDVVELAEVVEGLLRDLALVVGV